MSSSSHLGWCFERTVRPKRGSLHLPTETRLVQMVASVGPGDLERLHAAGPNS